MTLYGKSSDIFNVFIFPQEYWIVLQKPVSTGAHT